MPGKVTVPLTPMLEKSEVSAVEGKLTETIGTNATQLTNELAKLQTGPVWIGSDFKSTGYAFAKVASAKPLNLGGGRSALLYVVGDARKKRRPRMVLCPVVVDSGLFSNLVFGAVAA